MQCGAPHPEDVEFVQAPQEKIITEAQKIAEAEAGPEFTALIAGHATQSPANFANNVARI
jgi:hypothetical protein